MLCHPPRVAQHGSVFWNFSFYRRIPLLCYYCLVPLVLALFLLVGFSVDFLPSSHTNSSWDQKLCIGSIGSLMAFQPLKTAALPRKCPHRWLLASRELLTVDYPSGCCLKKSCGKHTRTDERAENRLTLLSFFPYNGALSCLLFVFSEGKDSTHLTPPPTYWVVVYQHAVCSEMGRGV